MRRSTQEYEAPARFDDLLEVFVRTARIGRTSTTFEYRVRNAERRDAARGRRPGDGADRRRQPARRSRCRVRGAGRSSSSRARVTLVPPAERADAIATIEQIVAHEPEADQILREAVVALYERIPDVRSVAVAFVENGALAPGPIAGDPIAATPTGDRSRCCTSAARSPSCGSMAADAPDDGDRASCSARLRAPEPVLPRRLGHRRRGLGALSGSDVPRTGGLEAGVSDDEALWPPPATPRAPASQDRWHRGAARHARRARSWSCTPVLGPGSRRRDRQLPRGDPTVAQRPAQRRRDAVLRALGLPALAARRERGRRGPQPALDPSLRAEPRAADPARLLGRARGLRARARERAPRTPVDARARGARCTTPRCCCEDALLVQDLVPSTLSSGIEPGLVARRRGRLLRRSCHCSGCSPLAGDASAGARRRARCRARPRGRCSLVALAGKLRRDVRRSRPGGRLPRHVALGARPELPHARRPVRGRHARRRPARRARERALRALGRACGRSRTARSPTRSPFAFVWYFALPQLRRRAGDGPALRRARGARRARAPPASGPRGSCACSNGDRSSRAARSPTARSCGTSRRRSSSRRHGLALTGQSALARPGQLRDRRRRRDRARRRSPTSSSSDPRCTCADRRAIVRVTADPAHLQRHDRHRHDTLTSNVVASGSRKRSIPSASSRSGVRALRDATRTARARSSRPSARARSSRCPRSSPSTR